MTTTLFYIYADVVRRVISPKLTPEQIEIQLSSLANIYGVSKDTIRMEESK